MNQPEWVSDVLGDPFESRLLHLPPDGTEELVATLVRRRADQASRQAVLYVHGFNDYFFQRDLAGWFAGRGTDFYAVDLRRHGRSIRTDQIPFYCASLDDYDPELDAAAAAILSEGHDEIVIVGHSTGGLTTPLWVARRPQLPVAALVLNSPFFEFREPAALRVGVGAAASVIARRSPLTTLPAGVGTAYGDSLHVSEHGEWDYDLAWKPSPGVAVRFGWLRAILAGQRRLHAGLELSVPTLVMCSTRSVAAKSWNEEYQRADGVLDADRIARWAPAVGRHVAIERIEDGMHDLFLSGPAARQRAYHTAGAWLDARRG